MIRFLEFAVAFVLLFVFVKFARQAFRRTPPDDRISDEDMFAASKSGGQKKPSPSSTKRDLPKDQH
jgi:hypothetical protein